MHAQKHGKRRRHRKERQKGSALLVSLMVMVGLSLLGLTFVAISETENLISINERNKTQTNAIAEAGANLFVQFFQDPEFFDERVIIPNNDEDFKRPRTLEGYTGYYKPDIDDEILFDTPFDESQGDQFYGDEDNADVIIQEGRNDDSDAYLELLNGYLLTDEEGGKIVDVRVYAPPIVGGVLLDGFWVGGQRYGLATIAVTAEKENARGAVIARSTCRIVVAPFPLPGPTGPVQVLGTFDPNGNYKVHWGSVESEETGELYIKRIATSLPRFDPYDYAYIEYGYDSSRIWKANTYYNGATFPLGETVYPTTAALAEDYEFVCTQSGTTDGTEPTWTNHLGGAEFTNGTAKFRLRPAVTAYPISNSGTGSPRTGYNNHNWLFEITSRGVDDPWFEVRTRGYVKDENTKPNNFAAGGTECNDIGSACISMAWDYPVEAHADMDHATNGAASFTSSAKASWRPPHYMQYQTSDNKYQWKLVDIPGFDYDFWKAAAQAGKAEDNVYYLRHTGAADANTFTDGLQTMSFEAWIAAKEGFLFFDTDQNYNPQTLTGGLKTTALVGATPDPCGARGMVYGNFTELKAGGCNENDDRYHNMPGEPYRDIGYRKVNRETSGTQIEKEFTTDATGEGYVLENAYNGKWDYQDLPFSNGDTEDNGFFDVCIGQRTMWRESEGAQAAGTSETRWVPLPYYPNCTVGNNVDTPACNCSEPHEPYININYTYNGSSEVSGGDTVDLLAEWEDPTSDNSAHPKKTDTEEPDGTPVTCTKADVASKDGQEKNCATNAWDKIGGLAELTGLSAPGTIGVIYNEGDYNSTGNSSHYGSVVAAGEADPSGTQEVWFDPCLVAGCWPPANIGFPRVMVTSVQIE